MATSADAALLVALEHFSETITKKFKVHVSFQPEDQLKGPTESQIKAVTEVLGLKGGASNQMIASA